MCEHHCVRCFVHGYVVRVRVDVRVRVRVRGRDVSCGVHVLPFIGWQSPLCATTSNDTTNTNWRSCIQACVQENLCVAESATTKNFELKSKNWSIKISLFDFPCIDTVCAVLKRKFPR